MKPIPELAALLDKARAKRMFGTKMRSFIKQANKAGIKDIVTQQFEVARPIIAAGLVPIIEPEVDIHCPDKARPKSCSRRPSSRSSTRFRWVSSSCSRSPCREKDDFYSELVRHRSVVRVLALSGGYSQEEGNRRLRRNHGVVASFSRALVEGLSAQQSDAEYNAMLGGSIRRIYEASIT
jgi:fructose-bisphosphate aldolase class I